MKTTIINLFKDEKYQVTFSNFRPAERLIELNQTHSDIICQLDSLGTNQCGEDGIIFPLSTTEKIAIRTADCLPIFYYGKTNGALVHAGWRGVQNKIFVSKKLIDLNPTHIITGPSICDSCFEVSVDFKNEFPHGTEYFYHQNGKLFFKIKSYAQDQLKIFFPQANFQFADKCTLCQSEWHSHRRNQTKERNFTIFQKVNL